MDNKSWAIRKPLTDRVPGFLERYSDNLVAKAVLSPYDDLLSELKDTVEGSEGFINPLTCPENWLDYLAALSGFTGPYWRIDYPVSFKRLIISRANYIWSNKGSKEVLNFILTSYGIQNIIENANSFIIGLSRVGDRVGYLPYEYTIFLNSRQENIENLRLAIPEFIQLYSPIWCKANLVDDFTRFQGRQFLGYQNLEDLVGLGYVESANRILIDFTQRSIASNNLFSNFSNLTLNYITNLGALDFSENLNFWNIVDTQLVKPLEQFQDDIELLSLFVGDTVTQKRLNIIGNNFTSFANGEAVTNGYRFVGNGDLVYDFDPIDSKLIEINYQILDANFGTEQFIYDTGVISTSVVEVGNVKTFSTNGETFEFSIAGDFSFNGSEIENDLYINGFELSKATLTSAPIDTITIGADALSDNKITATFRYFLILKKSNPQIGRIVTNFFRTLDVSLPLTVTEYHPDTFSYFTDVQNLGSSSNESSLNALNNLITNFYNVGIYQKLEYALPLISNGVEGLTARLKMIPGSTNVTDYSITNGAQFTNGVNRFIELDQVSSASFTENLTYLMGLKIGNNFTNNNYFYGCGNSGFTFGLENFQNSLTAYYAFNTPSIENIQYQRNRLINIFQNNLGNVSRVYLDGILDDVGIISNGAMSVQNLRIGSVIINDELQPVNNFNLNFFAKFIDLTHIEINLANGFVNQFNNSIGRS